MVQSHREAQQLNISQRNTQLARARAAQDCKQLLRLLRFEFRAHLRHHPTHLSSRAAARIVFLCRPFSIHYIHLDTTRIVPSEETQFHPKNRAPAVPRASCVSITRTWHFNIRGARCCTEERFCVPKICFVSIGGGGPCRFVFPGGDGSTQSLW